MYVYYVARRNLRTRHTHRTVHNELLNSNVRDRQHSW